MVKVSSQIHAQDIVPEASRAAEVEELKQQTDVKKALQQTAGAQPAPKTSVETQHRKFLGAYGLFLFLLGAFYYFLKLHSYRYRQRGLLFFCAPIWER
jgi:hypothetical protein